MKKFVAAAILVFSAICYADDVQSQSEVIKHLEQTGYKCKTEEQKILASYPSGGKLGFEIKPLKSGFLFKAWFVHSENGVKEREKFIELVNRLNAESTVIRYYIDRENDLVMEAWYPSSYQKASFTLFVNRWETDFLIVVKDHFQELAPFIK